MSTPPLAGAGMPPGAFSGTQAQAAREVNTASLCRIGQETVQDIVFRTMEIFQLLRNMQQLIPYVEEDGSKHDDRGAASQLRFASEERREIMEVNKKLKLKNQQLKQIMDQLRNLIWDINAMLAMRN
ncbi:mediator of RNA polymerase II transcription subunit 30 isoform X2 [Tympanuchus pallidicinctus]|uniref:mediator of RNA polymerase II transcription subunit 30 isoform X2 n=1 Tax=Lagopus leucura TaxID=30410 RepID=UPI001C67A2ED|nr:mediator of RNA polymerase II transcription subunit 30 isoform X2 [Lagopus leucura]XP_052559621.1 mediator of RNA polymerase II transcription subunit 30 isoform X2 [Tympanuchus pallidicinctus]